MFAFVLQIPNLAVKIAACAILIYVLPSFACLESKSKIPAANHRLTDYPPVILWAWERPEDLRFIDAKRFGVAFLSQTLILEKDAVTVRPRRQSLEVNPDTFLIAVTRIEKNNLDKSQSPTLSDSQKESIVSLIRQTLKLPNVKAVQIDFDALRSERNFYRSMLNELRGKLPENVSLTMTALASWCASDNWLNGLPVDDAVPMAFRMGLDDKPIRAFLANGDDWGEPLCRRSYGIALDEPLQIQFKSDRRIYIFNNRAWKAADLLRLPDGVAK